MRVNYTDRWMDHFAEVCLRQVAVLVALLGLASAASGAEVSFRNDVMAVLSKAGCNAGACHGNRNGKGGFKLSLRGQDAAADFASLTRDLYGRRTNLLEPEKSLILLKPTTAVSHQGGKRFAIDSKPYQILRNWIAQGMKWEYQPGAASVVGLEVTPGRKVLVAPEDGVKITASAIYSDGSRRDVSDLAVYEQSQELAKVSADGQVNRGRDGEIAVVVRFLQYQQVVRLAFVPLRREFVWKPYDGRNYIDDFVLAKLKAMRIDPSEPGTDLQFMRRAYLDLLGVLPTADEARAFDADRSEGKRAKLVDQLMERPEYADFWALKWSDLLRNEERALDRKGVQAFHRWIRDSVAGNKPLDRFARELVAARGSTYLNPATNFYRAERDPLERGEDSAEVFLGVRLKCARCHNHPFDRWSQDDYYNWADVFGRLNYRVIENRRTDTNDKHEFIGEQIVYESDEGDVPDPRPGHQTRPVLLGSGSTISDDEDRLDSLAQWMTGRDNPFFARAQVNRIWFNLMGRGLVDPVDDFRATNPASHPELLEALAEDFIKSGYDVRHMIRVIMNSQAYALSSLPNETNADDEINYSHNVPRRLAAEQMLDAQCQVTETVASFNGYPKGMRAGQIPGAQPQRRPSAAEQFLLTFGKPPRELACECERSTDTTLGQTFQLISGREIGRMIAEKDNRIGQLIEAGNTDQEIVSELYWSALTRPASSSEMDAMLSHVAKARDRRKGLEDVMWAVLNAKEFVLRS